MPCWTAVYKVTEKLTVYLTLLMLWRALKENVCKAHFHISSVKGAANCVLTFIVAKYFYWMWLGHRLTVFETKLIYNLWDLPEYVHIYESKWIYVCTSRLRFVNLKRLIYDICTDNCIFAIGLKKFNLPYVMFKYNLPCVMFK